MAKRRKLTAPTPDELAERVAAEENGVPREELSSAQRKRVYVSLYQTHVPKMEDAGLVDYDQETSMVSLKARAVPMGGAPMTGCGR